MVVFTPSFVGKLPEIVKIFGAVKLDNAYFTFTSDESGVLWFPNFNPKAKTGWENVIFPDGTISERNSNPDMQRRHMKMFLEERPFDQIRITFGKIDGEYRFLGVYQLDRGRSLEQGMCVWRRLHDTYELISPVSGLDARALQSKFVKLR